MGAAEARRGRISVQTDIIYLALTQSGTRVRSVTGPFGRREATFDLGDKVSLRTTVATLSAGSGDMEPSTTEPAVNHPKSVMTDYNGEPPRLPGTASPLEPSEQQAGDRVSFDAGQLDALFTEFLEYQKREAQRAGDNPSQHEALFAEFQTYVKHLLQQPDR